MSGTTTATNYGSEVTADYGFSFTNYAQIVLDNERDCCRVLEQQPHDYLANGPFLHNASMPVPKLTLTKTHCEVGARTYDTFETGCRTVVAPSSMRFAAASISAKSDNQSTINIERAVYDTHFPLNKAVHLLRSPYDNLVARKHLNVRVKMNAGVLSPGQKEMFNAPTKESFHAWCKYDDAKVLEGQKKWNELPVEMEGYLRRSHSGTTNASRIPCAADLWRYVSWHNFAARFIDERIRDVYLLYYEDYTSDYNATVRDLFTFLGLEAVNDPLPLVSSKAYRHYFSPEQKQAIKVFVKEWATSQSWKLLNRYFQDDGEEEP